MLRNTVQTADKLTYLSVAFMCSWNLNESVKWTDGTDVSLWMKHDTFKAAPINIFIATIHHSVM